MTRADDRSLRVLGILGGMGPAATHHLAQAITAATSAATDQDHVPVVTVNDPRIPSRLDALLGRAGTASKTPDPLPAMLGAGRRLVAAGADGLLMPCNLAHAWLEPLRAGLGLPFLDLPRLTARAVAARGVRRVALLASTPTLRLGLLHRPLEAAGLTVLEPTPDAQARVMEAIYGPGGVKAAGMRRDQNSLQRARNAFAAVGRDLIEPSAGHRGADLVVAACTEVSFAWADAPPPFAHLDPLATAAVEAVRWATSGCGDSSCSEGSRSQASDSTEEDLWRTS